MDEKEYVELRGTVEQIVFSNEENGSAVLRLCRRRVRRSLLPVLFRASVWARS